jgi:hypothetical protein
MPAQLADIQSRFNTAGTTADGSGGTNGGAGLFTS